MRATTRLLLRDLLSKLHPPSPATARESARLLTLLDSSFRQRLDEAHPPPNARQNAATHNSVPIGSSPTANTHLDSVLSHPLLETNRNDPTSATDAFDSSIRAGTLTLIKLKRIADQYRLAPGQHKLGPKIAAWLASETPTTKTAFFSFPPVVRAVVSAMYADGLEATVWKWLKSLYQREWVPDVQSISPQDTSLFLRLEDTLISEMMRISIRKNSLQDAAVQYIQASKYRHQSAADSISPSVTTSNVSQQPLLASYKSISAAILYRRSSHGIDPATFDQVLSYPIRFSHDRTVINSSIMQLYHPTSPSMNFLYTDLQDEAFVNTWNAWHSKHSQLHKAFLLSLFDAAQLSLDQQAPAKARFFLDFAETHWPEYVPAARKTSEDKLENRIRHAKLEVDPESTYSLAPT